MSLLTPAMVERTKAICEPSGEKDGWLSIHAAGGVVSRRCSSIGNGEQRHPGQGGIEFAALCEGKKFAVG